MVSRDTNQEGSIEHFCGGEHNGLHCWPVAVEAADASILAALLTSKIRESSPSAHAGSLIGERLVITAEHVSPCPQSLAVWNEARCDSCMRSKREQMPFFGRPTHAEEDSALDPCLQCFPPRHLSKRFRPQVCRQATFQQVQQVCPCSRILLLQILGTFCDWQPAPNHCHCRMFAFTFTLAPRQVATQRKSPVAAVFWRATACMATPASPPCRSSLEPLPEMTATALEDLKSAAWWPRSCTATSTTACTQMTSACCCWTSPPATSPLRSPRTHVSTGSGWENDRRPDQHCRHQCRPQLCRMLGCMRCEVA